MIWFLERNSDLLVCEIRPAGGSPAPAYEFQIGALHGPAQTLRFDDPTELIDTYLRKQAALRAKGWRPRCGTIEEPD